MLRADVAPSAIGIVRTRVHTPAIPGKYYLEFDLIQQNVAWFRDRGNQTVTADVEVSNAGVTEIKNSSTASGPDACLKPLADWRARLMPKSLRVIARAADSVAVDVRVTNESNSVWCSTGDYRGFYSVDLAYRILEGSRQIQQWNGAGSVASAVLPGESTTFSPRIKTPSLPGIYRIEFDMLQQGVGFFGQRGSPTASLTVVVK